jgi:hypothetical protein
MLGSSRDYIYFFKCRGHVYLLKPSGYLTYYQPLSGAHTFRLCFVRVTEQTATFAIYTITRLVLYNRAREYYSAVRTESYETNAFRIQRVKTGLKCEGLLAFKSFLFWKWVSFCKPFSVQRLLHVPPHLTLMNLALCILSVFVCFMWCQK